MDAEVAATAGSVVSAISHEPSDQQKRGSSGKWSDATWTHGKQLEQLLQQDTTLRGDNRLFEAHADIRLAAMETTMNNASPWTHFLLISPGVMSWRSVVFCCLPCSRSAIRATARRLLLVVKVVFVVFPNSAGRIGNSTNPITRFSGRTEKRTSNEVLSFLLSILLPLCDLYGARTHDPNIKSVVLYQLS